MTISFEVPEEIERLLAEQGGDANRAAKEAALVELYRAERLSHSELASALGISRYEADGVLRRHGVFLDLSDERILGDLAVLRQAMKR